MVGALVAKRQRCYGSALGVRLRLRRLVTKDVEMKPRVNSHNHSSRPKSQILYINRSRGLETRMG